ncbi:MAG: DUF87 domain-containing protein, partial [Candidatus Lokiarchaeota archaeon]|nr:DUF87 domain-containing protein [Candidatus Lokiarchaeota archaeon]
MLLFIDFTNLNNEKMYYALFIFLTCLNFLHLKNTYHKLKSKHKINSSILPLTCLISIIVYLLFELSKLSDQQQSISRFHVIFTTLFTFELIIFISSRSILKKTIKPIDIVLPEIKRSDRLKGKMFLGSIKSESPKKKIYIQECDYQKHIFVNGLTGMGKTNLIKMILIQISQLYETPFLLIEFKGEYEELSTYISDLEILKPGFNFSINIFNPMGEDPRIYAEKLFNLLVSCQIITFQEEYSAQMEKILIEILYCVCQDKNRHNWEGFSYYTEKIRNQYQDHIVNVNQTIISIQNRIRRIETGPLKSIFDCESDVSLKDLMNKRLVIDLSELIRLGGNKNDAVFFANVLFNNLWVKNLEGGKSDRIKHFTVIEDSIFFSSDSNTKLHKNTSYIEDMALLLRGTGECLFTINTRPTISENVMANAGVLISFQTSYDQKVMS